MGPRKQKCYDTIRREQRDRMRQKRLLLKLAKPIKTHSRLNLRRSIQRKDRIRQKRLLKKASRQKNLKDTGNRLKRKHVPFKLVLRERKPLKSNIALVKTVVKKKKATKRKKKAISILARKERKKLLQKHEWLRYGINKNDMLKCQEVMYTVGVKLMGPKMRKRAMMDNQMVKKTCTGNSPAKGRKPNKLVLMKMTASEKKKLNKQTKPKMMKKKIPSSKGLELKQKQMIIQNQPEVRLVRITDEMVNSTASKSHERTIQKQKRNGQHEKQSTSLENSTASKRLERTIKKLKRNAQSTGVESLTASKSPERTIKKQKRKEQNQKESMSQEDLNANKGPERSKKPKRNEQTQKESTNVQSIQMLSSAQMCRASLSELPQCECNPKHRRPCGSNSNCLNRRLMVECHPQLCPAGIKCQNQRFQKKEYPDTETFKIQADRLGLGLRTKVPIKMGQFVNEYRSIDSCPEKNNLSRYINHSDDPNLETQRWTVNGEVRVGLFALQDIDSGSELTFNHNFDHDCSNTQCSGTILKNTDTLGRKRKRTSQSNLNTSNSHHMSCIVLEDISKQKLRSRSSKTPKNSRRKSTRNVCKSYSLVMPMFDSDDEDDISVIDVDLSGIL